MLNRIDYYLDRVTMYRLVLYVLISFVGISFLYSFLGILSFSPLSILLSLLFLLFICWVTNKIFSSVFNAPTNSESVYISALILVLILTPLRSIEDIPLFGWVAVWTMASKYIFAFRKKHIFNPVGFGVALTALGINQSASWWIGQSLLVPIVVVGGLLVVRKIRRFEMVLSFLIIVVTATIIFALIKGNEIAISFTNIFMHSSLFFFAFIMLTEPLTTPPTKQMQLIYGGIIGLLFVPQMHIGTLYSTPELALIVGNIFSYIVSPKQKLLLTLKEKLPIAPSIIDFLFTPDKHISFRAGQYMEWTLPHKHTDSRGNRRYFTLASSPTEPTIRLGVKVYDKGSSFKKALMELDSTVPLTVSQLSGTFVLPEDVKKKLVFLAGGIGITPFRSMIKYLLDMHEKRSIVLFYANKIVSDIVYADVFEQAHTELSIKTIYTLTDPLVLPPEWQGKIGRIDEGMIQQEVPDYLERIFYLSGPHTMVKAFEETLHKMKVKPENIKIDFFSGFV